jgi:hypothetical protein
MQGIIVILEQKIFIYIVVYKHETLFLCTVEQCMHSPKIHKNIIKKCENPVDIRAE